jgi:mannose-1-phosphate guanylyltransferase/phosphomannomutase
VVKKRVSLTLDEQLIIEIDKLVDGLRIRSRSEAVENLLRECVAGRKTAVMLAGGNPKRLFISELGTYRPLVDVGGRTLIEDIMLKCRAAGFSNIILIGSAVLISRLYEVLGDGKKYDVGLTYIEESKELGTAKTLELAKKYLKTDFLFLPCDQWFDFDLRDLYEFHLAQGGVVTLGVHTRSSFDWRRGIVEMKGYKIISFEEIPKVPKTRLASVFIGFMKPDIFSYIPPGEVSWSLQENIFPTLAKQGRLVGYPVAGNWVNVHSAEDVKKIYQLTQI